MAYNRIAPKKATSQRVAALERWHWRRAGGLSNPDYLGINHVIAYIFGIE